MFSRHVRSLSSDDVERVIRQHSSNKFRESISGRPCFNATLSCIDCLPYKILFLETPVLIFFFSRINVYYCFDGFSFFFYLCNTMKIGIRYFTKKKSQKIVLYNSLGFYWILWDNVWYSGKRCDTVLLRPRNLGPSDSVWWARQSHS